MGIFSNLKINSLRKNTERLYEDRLENVFKTIGLLPHEQKVEMSKQMSVCLMANAFVKTMFHSLFHPDGGVFKDDVGNLNELSLNQLYQILSVWYIWNWIFEVNNGQMNNEGLDKCMKALEIGLGISLHVSKTYTETLTNLEPKLIKYALYRWSMITVSHYDRLHEDMLENSPDCQHFITHIAEAQVVAGNVFKK